MYFSKIAAGIFSLAAAVSATTVTYDAGYDDPNRSLEIVTCSDGENGVMWKYGWEQQSQVTTFPFIGGSETITDWNSTNCGTCWSATYRGQTVHILAIDYTEEGLNLGFNAFNTLTNGYGRALGRVDATVVQVPIRDCGL
ncbi:Cerato-platanin [Podospora didyma]|uniref:Cerato-platanin n=1 Tax=Podospora didyma TaxID=330526 RepID=A0AAE0K4P9_9PEZI|nr:Cerato-platanin [Podospora didyma]